MGIMFAKTTRNGRNEDVAVLGDFGMSRSLKEMQRLAHFIDHPSRSTKSKFYPEWWLDNGGTVLVKAPQTASSKYRSKTFDHKAHDVYALGASYKLLLIQQALQMGLMNARGMTIQQHVYSMTTEC